MTSSPLIALLASALILGTASTVAAAPSVAFVDVQAGPTRGGPDGQGVPIAIFGRGFGATRGGSRVTIGGREVARYLSWRRRAAANRRLDMIVVQPGPKTRTGRIVVRVRGQASRQRGWTFTPTPGRILAVAPTGVDSNNCSLARPCKTIQHAVDRSLRPGDALLVRGGQIADDEVWVRSERSGVAGRPITIRNYPGERPTFANTSRPMIVEADHVNVSGLAFPGGKSLVLGTLTSTGTRAFNNTFSGTLGYDAIGTHGNDIVVAGNVCAAAGSTVGTQGHCYYVSAGRGIRLLENVGRGVPGYPLHIFDQQRSSDDSRREIRDVLVQGNVLTGSTERSGLIVAMGDEGGRGNRITGVTIRGNRIGGNNHTGIRIGTNVGGVRIERNTIAGNGRQAITIDDEPTIAGITIRGNRLVQPPRGPCRSNCSWYRRAHIQVGPRARAVTIGPNRYAPGRPLLIGAQRRTGRSR